MYCVRQSRRSGQSLIEACLVIAMIALIFFGFFEVARVLAAREVLDHTAQRVARARAVGFNQWMVRKVGRVAAIPNAGQILEPVFEPENPELELAMATETSGSLWDQVLERDLEGFGAQVYLEQARIPEYLFAQNEAQAQYVMDYEDWDTITVNPGQGALTLNVSVHQSFPWTNAFSQLFASGDAIELHGEAAIENHYSLYLEDWGW